MSIIRICCILLFTTTVFSSLEATAAPIDLNAFFADPEVTIAPGGGSADFTESAFSRLVQLTNDPFLGDPNVIVPGSTTIMTFDYAFNEALDGNDTFSAYLFDADLGPVAGVLETFSISSTQAGMFSLDLAPYVGLTLGLQFELFDLDVFGTLGSTATVSNLALSHVVPIPAAIWLFGSGLVGLLGIAKRGFQSSVTDRPF